MSEHSASLNKPALQATANVAQRGQPLLQRRCACGGTPGLDGECEACRRKRLLRAATSPTTPTDVPPIVHEVSLSPLHSRDANARGFVEMRFGHNLGLITIQSAGAHDVQCSGADDKDKSTAPAKKPSATTKDAGPAQAKKSTTPDGIDLGPTDKKKAFCLKPSSFDVKTSVNANTQSVAQGAQVIKFEGNSTGQTGGKICDCGCGTYRHWINGIIQVIGPIALAKAQADLTSKSKQPPPTHDDLMKFALANTPKIVDFKSCNNALKLDENKFTEEYTSCIGDNDPDSCKWRYGDGPGATGGLSDGLYVNLKQSFKYEIWDSCQGKSVATKQATLTIQGDKAPRSITWS